MFVTVTRPSEELLPSVTSFSFLSSSPLFEFTKLVNASSLLTSENSWCAPNPDVFAPLTIREAANRGLGSDLENFGDPRIPNGVEIEGIEKAEAGKGGAEGLNVIPYGAPIALGIPEGESPGAFTYKTQSGISGTGIDQNCTLTIFNVRFKN
ncbi:hypothetical protein PPACK8108_LOCUS25543 [Phakopsora pachyrhizi]|uniref:Uncharacterized protein n=1 Tax=Phakopsora pachyrhizi TaxID=170000 RepID=A0AAV0BVY0_PHAPC|nr:hypothetical protein PPACK8108_LOCUS25543 [Phakopsora pachyrhizi]